MASRPAAWSNAPAALRSEHIGAFSSLVASVPVRLEGPEPAVLSIPLALRQREPVDIAP